MKKKTARSRKTHFPTPPTTPTPERQAKPDYEKIGKKRVRSDTLKTLYKTEKIGEPEIQAAQHWLSLWEMGMNGYCETAVCDDGTRLRLPGDKITFGFSQARALGKLGAFRRAEGREAHRTLILMLAQSLPFTLIGTRLYPLLAHDTARRKASVKCAEVLIALAFFWKMRVQDSFPVVDTG